MGKTSACCSVTAQIWVKKVAWKYAGSHEGFPWDDGSPGTRVPPGRWFPLGRGSPFSYKACRIHPGRWLFAAPELLEQMAGLCQLLIYGFLDVRADRLRSEERNSSAGRMLQARRAGFMERGGGGESSRAAAHSLTAADRCEDGGRTPPSALMSFLMSFEQVASVLRPLTFLEEPDALAGVPLHHPQNLSTPTRSDVMGCGDVFQPELSGCV